MLLTGPAQAQFLGAEAARCGADHVVAVLREYYEKELVEELNANPFTQVQGIQASITRMRESKRYERSIKKRFCRAEVSVRFIGVNDFLKFGLALNGFNPETRTLDVTIDYSVQLLDDGTDFIELDDE